MTRGTLFALGLEAVVMAALLLVALDQYAHKRVEQVGGVNTWGYRGAVIKSKRPNEVRIAVVGGDQAFGWGVGAGETVAPRLRLLVSLDVDRPGQPARVVTVANLGAVGLPVSAYADRVERFAYLRPDIVCLIIDPAAAVTHMTLPPADSIVTALTGYVPILPLVLAEKGQVLAAGGHGAMGRVVGAAGRGLRAADRGLYRLAGLAPAGAAADPVEVAMRAIDAAHDVAPGVVVAVQTPRTRAEWAAHDRLSGALEERAAGDDRLRVVDLGRDPRLYEPAVYLDGANLGAGGHALVADPIAPDIIRLLHEVAGS